MVLGRDAVGRRTREPRQWDAFRLCRRDQVDAFHRAALAQGGRDEGAPGLRPRYSENYYGAYVRDLDGNKLQAVCHTAG